MIDIRKIGLVLCLPGIFCSNLFFLVNLYVFFSKISSAALDLLINPLGSVPGVFFNKCGKYDLRIYFTLLMTNSSGQRSFSIQDGRMNIRAPLGKTS